MLTSSHATSEAQAQSPSTTPSIDPFDDSGPHAFPLLHFPGCTNPIDAFINCPWLETQCQIEGNFRGCANLNHLWGSTLESHVLFSKDFFLPTCVYIRFTHINNMQPKFYIGAASHHVLDRESSRSGKYLQLNLQLTHDKLVQAELALRYWREHQNLYMWVQISLFTCRPNYRSLEVALIQEWQPRLNYPFICQFFHPKKGLLKRPAMNTNARFGLATLLAPCSTCIDSHHRSSRTS